MKPTILGIAAAAMLASVPAFAQTGTTPSTGTTAAPAARSGVTSDHSTTTGTSSGNVMPPGAPGNRTGEQAASGNTNQPVATTAANAAQPAHGANSFTVGQAKSRFEKEGFSNVTNLRKGDDGVWHAQAQKDGSPAQVWLDYKGNIGAGQ
jgi:hypothetical protein